MIKCKFYYGDYYYRQQQANEDNALVYIEHHFNSDYKGLGNYCMGLVASNASQTSKDIARFYASKVEDVLGIPKFGEDGLFKAGFKGRGDSNLRFTKMPAVLLEPAFVSNKEHVGLLLDKGGLEKLAYCLASTINHFFGDKDGIIAFSVGHKYKRTKPNDRGASVRGRPEFTEADLAEQVLWMTKCLVEKE